MLRTAITMAAILLAGAVAAQAQFGPSKYPIKDPDGDLLSNHDIAADTAAQLERLPSAIAVGNPKGDVTLVQFYDLNCPFCREAARDVETLLTSDPRLKLVFVPYPVLSEASVQGGRVEMAFASVATPEQFREFHKRIYAGRGLVDGARALTVARDMGFDPVKLREAGDSDDTTDKLVTHARLAAAMGLVATPSYIIKGVAILGHPGLKPLEKVIAAVRRCGKVVC